ncbi:Vegetative incompatibility protein HET-E-1 [Madurella mycetomatis]|uniref:Vegetative incompatibility protein HET-E-1 n=1 Tax=Madurella mycetomatis TaxID=100816 RepID=A0A175VQL8_9PEZI|nr:Vegetative incompatibility protein HET-E-1 [Madurella mycetomatis]
MSTSSLQELRVLGREAQQSRKVLNDTLNKIRELVVLSRDHLDFARKMDRRISDANNRACLQDLQTTNPCHNKERIELDKGGLLKDSTGESRLLWIKGDPGKGKTILLYGIVDKLVALSNILTGILNDKLLQDTYFIIDALDECTTGLDHLLKFIVKNLSAYSNVKWVVSSRNWPSIERGLDRTLQKVKLSLELNEKSVSTAVDTYIQSKVDELAERNKYDSDTRNKIQQYLSLNSNGTFL